MNKIKIKTKYKKIIADTITPVSVFLKIRDRYPKTILLESSDYHGNDNNFSFICFDPMSSIEIKNSNVKIKFPNSEKIFKAKNKNDLLDAFRSYSKTFEHDNNNFKFPTNGLFGFISYDSVQYFEDIKFNNSNKEDFNIPDIYYSVYRYILVFDHFKNELFVFEHFIKGNNKSKIDHLISIITNKSHSTFLFETIGNSKSNFSDKNFLDLIKKGIKHCKLGDVFQIVLSKRFSQQFSGDDFQVYRALRSINPSPYLFYFDYGNYKIFGSSPEAQLVIKNRKAIIYPIAGTFKRSGNDHKDALLARKLYDDPKENSEHVMLVDLARNDLSRKTRNVKVEIFKEIQYYSHVIHLVSKVSGDIVNDNFLDIITNTFPAGTLSGAPKHMAMKLIDKYENINRGFYGGAIGYMGFNGDFNHAIIIRSFLSFNNNLFYQAGAGIVAKSDPKN